MERLHSALSKGIPRCGFLIAFTSALVCGQGVISTVAGSGNASAAGDGGPATSASFHPDGLTLDSAGNIYIADQNNNRIRKVDLNGNITTVAGNGNTQFNGDGGPATSATVYIAANHNGLAVDAAGNLYIADDGHHRIRKVNANGIITTVAGTGAQGFSGDGGPATSAQLYRPSGVAVDHAGNLYIADMLNRRIRKVDTSGIITTLAGTGEFGSSGDGAQAVNATLETPVDVTVDAAGNVYVADQDTNTVRKISPAGIISLYAGNNTFGFSGDGGPAVNAAFAGPYSVTLDGAGNAYISDYGNHRVRKVDPSGVITTIAGAGGASAGTNGDGGPPLSANVNPAGVAFDSAGNYYIADLNGNRIRKVNVSATVPGLNSSAGSIYFSTLVNGNTPASQILTVSTLGTVPLGFKASASTSSGGNWLQATTAGVNTPSQITVSVLTLPPAGIYRGSVVLTPNSVGLAAITVPVTLNVVATAAPKPAVAANGVVNAASFKPGVTANALVTIQGTNLASTTDDWNKAIGSGQLPTSLDGVTVVFNGKPGYITYISPTQINVLAPDVSAGTASILVTNLGANSGIVNVSSSLAGPAFFLWPGNQPVATHQDYSYAVKAGTFAALPTVAAKPGDVLVLWGTGFGAATPTPAPGIPVPGDKLYSTSALPTVTINNLAATVYGAALTAGYAGLYQVAIQVPTSLADGDWPVVATIGSVASPTSVVLSVKH
jgi:uncharacterized protein (TIGR03437 family)